MPDARVQKATFSRASCGHEFALFGGSWAEIAGKTAATQEEVKRAGEIGPQIIAALGVREHGKGPGPTEAADKRARAFSLLVHAYDQTRRAVAYLRWDEGDADTIAPSLYKGRAGRTTSSSSDTADTPPDEAPGPTAPASPGTAPPVPLPGTAAPTTTPSGTAPPGVAPNGAPPTS
ncbi:uncharacterized protein SOCEGT47_025790 [Sorangium cellulosum]|uniref:Uncharacterized protein n=1 Tax=Sorangium cellulosum TaxID=56 RepID=A0A4P2PZM4_SORCE|nr:hypothetical protein [Sorangium cellulosum]AUX22078.1 uncharacterized protein SOCEGT47_025790 [Sorangium cellulosum]